VKGSGESNVLLARTHASTLLSAGSVDVELQTIQNGQYKTQLVKSTAVQPSPGWSATMRPLYFLTDSCDLVMDVQSLNGTTMESEILIYNVVTGDASHRLKLTKDGVSGVPDRISNREFFLLTQGGSSYFTYITISTFAPPGEERRLGIVDMPTLENANMTPSEFSHIYYIGQWKGSVAMLGATRESLILTGLTASCGGKMTDHSKVEEKRIGLEDDLVDAVLGIEHVFLASEGRVWSWNLKSGCVKEIFTGNVSKLERDTHRDACAILTQEGELHYASCVDGDCITDRIAETKSVESGTGSGIK
jgi:hypothetical protein